MSHTIRRTLRGIEVTIIVNGDWSGDAEVHVEHLVQLAPGRKVPRSRACWVATERLLTGALPMGYAWEPDLWGAAVAVAVGAYLRDRYQAAVEGVSLPEPEDA